MTTRPVCLISGFIFILVLSGIVFLFQGLPASDIDDQDKIILSRATPWNQFAASFLTPWSQSRNWVGQTDRYDEVHYKRIVLPMLLKLSQQWFGLSSFAMYFLTKGLFFAGCVTLLFLFLAQIVPMVYAFLGIIVFLFAPAHYTHALWIADTGTLCYFFLFSGIGIFYALQKNLLERGSNRQFAWLLLALFAVGWTGIKAKEPMLLLPVVVFLYSLGCFRSWKQAPIKFLLVNAVMALVAFQIIPVTHLGASSLPSVHFNFETIVRLFFKNYACGYEDEKVSAFFSWDHVFPVSVARTLGFFMLWSAILSGIIFVWRKYISRNKNIPAFWGHPLMRIFGIWFLAELTFLGMFQADPRYFSGILAPLIVLIVRLVYCAAKGMTRLWRVGFLFLWLFSIGFNIYENAQNVLSVRIMLGKKFQYLLETSRAILEDIQGGKVADELALGKFYCSLPEYRDQPGAIKNQLYYADLGISFEAWNKVRLGKDSLEDFELQARTGYKYYVSLKELNLLEHPEIIKIGSVDGINKTSLLERLLYKKKKKRPATIKIYKYA